MLKLRINHSLRNTSYSNGEPIQEVRFHADDERHQGWVVAYPKAIPPFVRVIFASPLREEYRQEFEAGSMPDIQENGVISELVNRAVEVTPAES